jgi:hypothetical protein
MSTTVVAGLGLLVIPFLIAAVVGIFILVCMWTVFSKAGQPGWGCLIPIFNLYCLIKIAGKPGWWLLLFFIPFVNIVVAFLVLLGVAHNFGKGDGFGVGLFFLPFIFYPILAFGNATHSSTQQPPTYEN